MINKKQCLTLFHVLKRLDLLLLHLSLKYAWLTSMFSCIQIALNIRRVFFHIVIKYIKIPLYSESAYEVNNLCLFLRPFKEKKYGVSFLFFVFLNIYSCYRFLSFCSRIRTRINHKIKKIPGNIGVMLLALSL